MLESILRPRGIGTRASLALLAIGAVSLPSVSFAHIDSSFPPMRGGNQKVGPCEGAPVNPDLVTVLEPGSELTIRITETIPHPGHFRVMFDADITDGEDFLDPVNCDDVGTPDGVALLADNLLPAQGGTCPGFHTPSERIPTRNAVYELPVTLPDIECDNCALQIVQVMTDASKADADGNWDPAGGKGLYYRCADVRLARGEDPTPDPGPVDPGGPTLAGGCSTTGGSGGPATLVFMAIVGLALARRRR